MSSPIEIQLNSFKNISSINVDENINIDLKSSTRELISGVESSVINVSQLFDQERQAVEIYRIYGRIDFISIINGLKLNFSGSTDFFTPPRLGDELSGITKNILNCFDIYVCCPSTGNTSLTGLTASTYIRDYLILTKLENFEIYKAGFSRNIFFNYIYSYDVNVDFDISNYLDSFGKPLTNFYLFFNYKNVSGNTNANVNGIGEYESVYYRDFVSGNISGHTYTAYTKNNVVTGDLVQYSDFEFEETLIERMEYYVNFKYSGVSATTIQFKYYPFIPIKIRDFSDEIVSGNISGGTENDLNIPSYAIKIDNNGNYIWKNFLTNGFIDPITNKGVDYPFINKKHYIFSRITLPMKPNLDDQTTEELFRNIRFKSNTSINTKPLTNLNSLGNKCA